MGTVACPKHSRVASPAREVWMWFCGSTQIMFGISEDRDLPS